MTPTTGRLTVVGLGPGDPGTCSPDATAALVAATDLVGYGPYLDMVPDVVTGTRHPTENREEADRARHALELAAAGGHIALVSSGDPGVFAMAAAVMEQLEADSEGRWSTVDVVVHPGVTAAHAAAARIGAPLGHDFCVISLSDNLKPWSVIADRLGAAARADFVIAIYNPRSRQRPDDLGRAAEIIGQHRQPTTPVVIGRDIGRPEESVTVITLAELADAPVDMRTVVIIGSSTTRRFVTAGGREWTYTPRWYPEGHGRG